MSLELLRIIERALIDSGEESLMQFLYDNLSKRNARRAFDLLVDAMTDESTKGRS